MSKLIFSIFLLLSFISFLFAQDLEFSQRNLQSDRARLKKKGKGPSNGVRTSLEEWASMLNPNQDYSHENWKRIFHTRSIQDMFNGYALKLSEIFKKNGAYLNFALVGACDGNADGTIRDCYLPNNHWRGVFVEPMSLNVRDLQSFLETHHADHRSHIIRAAATDTCTTPTIFIERPLYEEKNASTPHWLRRQINSILPAHRTHARKDWITEEVRCVTANDILMDWASVGIGKKGAGGGSGTKVGSTSSRERKIGNDGVMDTGSSSGSSGSSSFEPGGDGYNRRILEEEEQTGEREKGERDMDEDVSLSHRILKVKKRRPHVLKIDVEGHDYQVLMGFISDNVPEADLPLLIAFEAKSIAKRFDEAKTHMEKRGYVVSDFANDGFALLKGDALLASLGGGGRGKGGLSGGNGGEMESSGGDGGAAVEYEV